MPAPTPQELIASAQEMYDLMESYRTGSQASKVVSALSFGYAQLLSIKTTKFDALAKAEDVTQRRAAMKALKEDKEVVASNSLKNIATILDHALEASLGCYVEGTDAETLASSTPAEAADDAIDKLTKTYNEQFASVPNKSDFLLKVSESIKARQKIEKQQAVESARAEEKLRKQLELANAQATADLEKNLALDAANKATERLETEHQLTIERNKASAEKEIRRLGDLHLLDAENEIQRLQDLYTEAANEIQRLQDLYTEAENEIQRLQDLHTDAANENLRLHELNDQAKIAYNQATNKLEILAGEYAKAVENANSAHEEVMLGLDTIYAKDTQIKQLTADLDTARTLHSATTAKKDKEVAHLNHELSAIFQENQRLLKEIGVLTRNVTQLISQVGLKTEELYYTKQESNKKQAEQARRLAQLETVQTRMIHDATNRASTLSVALLETRANTAALERQLAHTVQEHKNDHSEIAKLQEVNATLSAQTNALADELQTYEAMLALANEQVKEKEHELQHRDFAAELKAEQATSQSAKRELGSAKANNDGLESQLHSIRGTYDNELNINRELRRTISDLTQQINDLRLAKSASSYSNRHRMNRPQPQHNQEQQQQHQHQNTKSYRG